MPTKPTAGRHPGQTDDSQEIRSQLALEILLNAYAAGASGLPFAVFRGHIGDDLLALDAIVFLAACVFSYASLRSAGRPRRRELERIADGCFGAALVLMTAVCVMIAWEVV